MRFEKWWWVSPLLCTGGIVLLGLTGSISGIAVWVACLLWMHHLGEAHSKAMRDIHWGMLKSHHQALMTIFAAMRTRAEIENDDEGEEWKKGAPDAD